MRDAPLRACLWQNRRLVLLLAAATAFAPMRPTIAPRNAVRPQAEADAEDDDHPAVSVPPWATATTPPKANGVVEPFAATADAFDDDDEDDLEDDESAVVAEDMAILRELFIEAVASETDGPLGDLDAASLYDLDDAQFKLLMLQRLGKEDYDRIFRDPRVESELD